MGTTMVNPPGAFSAVAVQPGHGCVVACV